jgi:hypothetical protein
MPLAESFGQATEVQFWLMNKPADICPAHTPTKRGNLFDGRFAPVIFGSSRNAVISACVYQSQSVKEEMGRKMHAHPGSRRHSDLPLSN